MWLRSKEVIQRIVSTTALVSMCRVLQSYPVKCKSVLRDVYNKVCPSHKYQIVHPLFIKNPIQLTYHSTPGS